jgi:hypothetical protein
MGTAMNFLNFSSESVSPLQYFENDEAIDYEEEKITECRAVRLFYLIYGRNAWHETWVTKYFDGCMSPSLDATKKTAEQKRVQGSVFYISEIPALQFISARLSILVTEINSVQPLQYCQEFHDDMVISPKSVYDHFSPAKANSIIRLGWKKSQLKQTTEGLRRISYNLYDMQTLSPSDSFKKYKSFSQGKEHCLGWNEINHNMSQSAVKRMATQIDNFIINKKISEYHSTCDEMFKKITLPIVNLELSDAAFGKISSTGSRFVGDLVQYTEHELSNVVSDKTCVDEIKTVLAEMGLHLKPEKPVIACDYKKRSVDELELSIRTANALKNANILQITQLTELSEEDLLCMQGFNRKSLHELKDVLSDFDLKLAEK